MSYKTTQNMDATQSLVWLKSEVLTMEPNPTEVSYLPDIAL